MNSATIECKSTGDGIKTRQVEELYVAAFTMPVGRNEFAEVIMSGIYGNGQTMIARSTVEHDLKAVPSLIRLCKEIEQEHGLSWRLLKFDRSGIHELDRTLYEEYLEWVGTHELM